MDYSGYFLVEVGSPETGKTSVALKILQRKVYKSILFVLSDDDDSIFHKFQKISLDGIKNGFTGVRKIILDDIDIDIDELFEILFRRYKGVETKEGKFIPVALLLDDSMSMLDPRNVWVMKYCKKRRQRICDIIVNCHGLSEFPVSLYKNISNIYIFHTIDSIKNLDNRINARAVEIIELLTEYVNIIGEFGLRNQTKHKYFHVNFNTKMPPNIEDIKLAIASNWWIRNQPKFKLEGNGTIKNETAG